MCCLYTHRIEYDLCVVKRPTQKELEMTQRSEMQREFWAHVESTFEADMERRESHGEEFDWHDFRDQFRWFVDDVQNMLTLARTGIDNSIPF